MVGHIKHSPNDRLSRFIRHKRLTFKKTFQVKPNAFLPPSDKRLSVFHTENLKEHQIWLLADQLLKCDRNIEYRADLSVHSVAESDLSLDWNYNPKYHVDIIGWPEGKDDQKAMALELARRAELKIRD